MDYPFPFWSIADAWQWLIHVPFLGVIALLFLLFVSITIFIVCLDLW